VFSVGDRATRRRLLPYLDAAVDDLIITVV